MTDVQDPVDRNAVFAARPRPDLRINPRGDLMVIGCVDPRVDPAHVLGLEEWHVSDPAASVAADVEIVLSVNRGPGVLVSGLVYDVATGLVETVVPPTPLPPG